MKSVFFINVVSAFRYTAPPSADARLFVKSQVFTIIPIPFNWAAPPYGAELLSNLQSVIVRFMNKSIYPVESAPPNRFATLSLNVQFLIFPDPWYVKAPPWSAVFPMNIQFSYVVPFLTHPAPPWEFIPPGEEIALLFMNEVF